MTMPREAATPLSRRLTLSPEFVRASLASASRHSAARSPRLPRQHAALTAQGHHAHDALPVDAAAVLAHPDVAGETPAELDELGGGPQMKAQLVYDRYLALQSVRHDQFILLTSQVQFGFAIASTSAPSVQSTIRTADAPPNAAAAAGSSPRPGKGICCREPAARWRQKDPGKGPARAQIITSAILRRPSAAPKASGRDVHGPLRPWPIRPPGCAGAARARQL